MQNPGQNKHRLLIVDDNALNLDQLLALLGETYDLRVAIDGVSALRLVAAGFQPDLVLLDIMMPEMDGYEVCRRLRDNQSGRDIPVIFLTSLDSEEDEAKGLELGAVDYITKPFTPAIVRQRVRTQLELKMHRDRLQELVDAKVGELRRSEQRLRQAQRVAQVGNWEYDPNNDRLDWSEEVYRIYSVGPEDFLQTYASFLELVHPEDRERVDQAYRRSLQERTPYDVEHRIQLADGRIKHVQERGETRFNDAGTPQVTLGTVQDITARKLAEIEIIRAKEQWESTFDAMSDMVSIHDHERRIIRANSAVHDYAGADYGELNGKLCCEVFRQQDPAQCPGCPLVRTIVDGQVYTEQITNPHSGMILAVTTAPVGTRYGGEYYIHVARDITRQRQLEDEASRANRLAALGELAAGIAHEINNPNALTIYNSEFLEAIFADLLPWLNDHPPENPAPRLGGLPFSDALGEIPVLFPAIQDSARRIKRIVDDLRDFARQDSSDSAETIDFNAVVEAAVRLVNNPIKKATDHFHLELAPDLPDVRGVKGRLEQVIINLLLNACQALEERSQRIFVTTRYRSAKQQVQLTVSDEGRGIADADLDHILEPFFTTKRDQGGTGLGLSVSSRIVKEHRGHLEFKARPEGGTTVVLSLPVNQENTDDD